MSYTPINLGSADNDHTGSNLKAAGTIINANFAGHDATIASHTTTLAALGTAANQASSFFVAASTLAAASGVATLDSGGKLTAGQIPASLTGAMNYQGTWNASTNSPTLASSTGTKGYLYKVTTAGSTTLDGISVWNVGDSAVFNGATWDKWDGIINEVVSVAGRTGVVTLSTSDISGLGTAATHPATDFVSAASPTFTGVATSPVWATSGITGATAANRHVGGTTGGAPTSGTFAKGDYIVDQNGIMWICVTAGTPGTWNYIGDPPVQALGSISGSNAVDWRKSNRFSLTMSANVTLTMTAPLTCKTLKLYVTNTGSFTLTLPTYLKSGGSIVVVTTGAAVDVLAGDYDGTNYYWADALPNVS
jgi:hypothetical protein